jgi:hypothetical protein
MSAGGDVEIHAGASTLQGGPVRVQVLGAEGAPYPFAFGAPDGGLVLTAPVRRLEGLAPGRYLLRAAAGEPQPFVVEAGRLAVVTLP